jgi:hypothetical protein
MRCSRTFCEQNAERKVRSTVVIVVIAHVHRTTAFEISLPRSPGSKTLERGEELIHLPTRKEVVSARIDERIERVPTEHDEMQWRLIRLGQLCQV